MDQFWFFFTVACAFLLASLAITWPWMAGIVGFFLGGLFLFFAFATYVKKGE